MLVKEFMTPTVVTVREDQSMLEAREIMNSKALLSLPVVDDLQRVRGIITKMISATLLPAMPALFPAMKPITCWGV